MPFTEDDYAVLREAAKLVPEISSYVSLWLSGNESGPSVWNRKLELSEQTVLGCAKKLLELNG
jgi:hypothetical protein